MAELQIRDLTPAFGAEVIGLTAPAEWDEETRRLLRSAFNDRTLLLFRDLDFDRDDQMTLADMLIGWEDRPANGGSGSDLVVSNKEPGGNAPFGRLLFHSDMMWADEPFQVLSLYAAQVEPPAVPTMFASTTSAWDTLPDDLRARVEGLHALHVTGQQRRGKDDDDSDLLEGIRDHERSTTTLIGHPHPRTGRTTLYVSQMTTREIVGLPSDESEELLEALFAHLYSSANVWQHDWHDGDMVMWDNLAIQHARGNVTTEGPARTLRKVISPIPAMAATIESPRFNQAR